MNLRYLLLAGFGGLIGSMCRYWMSTLVYRIVGQDFPYGTLSVNILGCLLIGLLMSIFDERFLVNPGLRILLTIGILGGFTTFSSFSYETIGLLREGSYWLGFANILVSVVACLGSTWLGLALGKLI